MIDIRKIAREAGFEFECRDIMSPNLLGYVTDELARFANAILEAAAVECENYVWFEDGTRSPDESNIGCAAKLRAMKVRA